MKRRMLAVALIAMGFASTSFARGLDFNTSGTKLDQLVAYAQQGTLPTWEELIGSWSGRSFFKATPDTPGGGFLVCGTHEEDLGPLFPEEHLGCYTMSYFTSNTDLYDNVNNVPLTDSKTHLKKVAAVPNENNTALCYDNSAQDVSDAFQGQTCLTKYSDYIVYTVSNGSETLYAGYFFVKH